MGDVILPPLGEGIQKATVACWHNTVGNQVNADEDIVELVTDKASFQVPAGMEGKIKEIRYNVGDVANIGDILAVIEPL